jgi:hypothetical protein
MATVIKGCTTKEQRSVVCFFCVKGLNAKYIHNCMAKVSLMSKRLKRRGGSGSDNSQKTYAASFDALVKQWDRCINVRGEYVEK